jgi:hypothetical protein
MYIDVDYIYYLLSLFIRKTQETKKEKTKGHKIILYVYRYI